MERVALDGELGHLGIRDLDALDLDALDLDALDLDALDLDALDLDALDLDALDLDALGIAAGVDLAADGQAGLGGRGADQLNDNLMADQRLAAPVPGDVGEEPVFDPVPFAGPGRQVRHGDGQAGLVGKALQLALPQPHAGAVAAAAVGGDDQPLGLGVARLAEFAPPAPDALDREGRRVGIQADADPAGVGGEVVDAVGRYLAQPGQLEIMHPHRLGPALRAQFAAGVLEVADQLLLLGVHRDGRLARRDRRLHRCVDVGELGVAVGMVRPLPGLAVGLTAVAQPTQQSAHQLLADPEAAVEERPGDLALAAADPA